MVILFPSRPFDLERVASEFELEEQAALKAGFRTALVSFDMFSDEPPKFARLPEQGVLLYRGWLLTADKYAQMQTGLQGHGCSLVTDHAALLETSLFPNWYDRLVDFTPRSIYLPFSDAAGIIERCSALAEIAGSAFGDRPILVKDYLKSRKDEWFDACFMHSAADATEVRRVVTNFAELQGDKLTGGVVFREFVKFERAGTHPKSRMPLIKEWRLFVLHGKPLYMAPYWSTGIYGPMPKVPKPWLAKVLAKLSGPFYVLDIARDLDGVWKVVEVNDGGMAGIPEGGSPGEFYRKLFRNRIPAGVDSGDLSVNSGSIGG